MATIIPRRKKYAVVYNTKREDGTRRQVWETFGTLEEAVKRKDQVEYLQRYGFERMPSILTIRDLMGEFVKVYGVPAWAYSTYESKIGLIENYINPTLGDIRLIDINGYNVELYYKSLFELPAVSTRYRKAATEYVSDHTVQEIWKIIRKAFDEAVRWGLLEKNYAADIKPKSKKNSEEMEIWTPGELLEACDLCEDLILLLAMHLSFACSLRIGEVLGLRWKDVKISDEDIEKGVARIIVKGELQRVNKDVVQTLGRKDILVCFPALIKGTKTQLVIKIPKTQKSERTVYLPMSVVQMLKDRKRTVCEEKTLFPDDYVDYDLVFCNSIGRPIEITYIEKCFSKLISENNLRKVVFHSLRHTSITYKLKLTGGDLKAVQGDSGHAGLKMIEDVYSHILDEDRRKTAQLMEDAFYSKIATKVQDDMKKKEENNTRLEDELRKLLSQREIIQMLRELLMS